MSVDDSNLKLIEPKDALASLSQLIRRVRQREGLTQGELARKSGVPATTISRLERSGLASTDSLFRLLFALDLLDSAQDFLVERLRLASLPKTLMGTVPNVGTVPGRGSVPFGELKRVRHRKGMA